MSQAQKLDGESLTTRPQSNYDNATGYLDYIRDTRPDVYDEFLRLLKDYFLGTIDTGDLTARVSVLFDGDTELMQRFEAFSQ
jgi:histone deacetylase complex regulatory component SIN3